MRGWIDEGDVPNSVALPPSREHGQGVPQHPPISFARGVHSEQRERLYVVRGVEHTRHQGTDQICAVQRRRRRELDDREVREPLVDVAAQQVEVRPLSLLSRRPGGARLERVGPARYVGAPYLEDFAVGGAEGIYAKADRHAHLCPYSRG